MFRRFPLPVSVAATGNLAVVVADTPIEISVTPSRTSGVAPLGVFFDATATTSPETSLPFHELYALWDFDDPGSGTWSHGHATLNSRNEARGLVAAHLYTTAGTYVPILTVFDGTNIEQKVCDTITVTAESSGYTEYHYFSNDTDFTGAPAEDATHIRHSNISDFDVDVAPEIAANQIVYLAGGDTFNISAQVLKAISSGPWAITSFGTGQAIISSTVGGVAIAADEGSTDGRIYNVEATGGDTANSVFFGLQSGTEQADNMTLWNLNVHNFAQFTCGFAPGDGDCSGWFVHDCTYVGRAAGGLNGIRIDGSQCSLQGNTVDGNAGTESPLRTGFWNKWVISHNYFTGNPAGKELLAIRGSNGLTCQYLVISDNECEPDDNPTMQFGPPDASTDVDLQDIVVERNWSHKGAGGTADIDLLGVTRATIRNNLFDGTGQDASSWRVVIFRTITGQATGACNDIWIYNNTAYMDMAEDTARFIFFSANDDAHVGVIARNNLVYAPNAGTTTFEFSAGTDTDFVSSNNSATEPASNGMDDSPSFAGSGGDGSGTFTVPNDFKILVGSYANGAGRDDILGVFEDYFGTIRNQSNMDIGFHAFNTDTLPAV